MIWPDPTHQPTHPPTHQTIHLPLGGAVSTDFKSSNRIEISWLVQVQLNFDWFWGSPQGVGVGRWGWEVVRGCPLHMCTCTCMHAHTCMHMHACTCMYDITGNSHGFPQWGQPFAWNYHVYLTCMCVWVHACMHVHVHMCVGHHPITPHPHPPTPYPQSHREPKTPKFNNSWTNWDNLILFEDSLPLNIPELI